VKVVYSKQIEEKWAGNGKTFRARDVTARVELERHYAKYPHLRPKHLRNQDAIRSDAEATEAAKKAAVAVPLETNERTVVEGVALTETHIQNSGDA
jgi:hypothetical protein